MNKNKSMDPIEIKWIYHNSESNRERFTIGEAGTKTLVCIGINPSTAVPGKLDATMRAVKSHSSKLGYNSWIMINVYPQRSTDPKKIHKRCNRKIHAENIAVIKKIFSEQQHDIWAAWGTLIKTRKYFLPNLKEIRDAIGVESKWFAVGPLLKEGHPHHPLYLKLGSAKKRYDIDGYLEERI